VLLKSNLVIRLKCFKTFISVTSEWQIISIELSGRFFPQNDKKDSFNPEEDKGSVSFDRLIFSRLADMELLDKSNPLRFFSLLEQ